MTISDNSLIARLLRRSAKIETNELPAVVSAFVLIFMLFFGYFAVRPVRETLGTVLGRERVENLFVVTWIASIAVVMLYATLVARVRRAVLLPAIYGAVALLLAIIGVVLQVSPNNTLAPSVFYVTISVLNLFIVSVFWSFLLEIFAKEQTKRLFGVIAVGGSAGALVGPVVTDLVVKQIGNSGVLYIGAVAFVVAIVCQRRLIHLGVARERAAASTDDRPVGSANPCAGLILVVRSPYLLGIALFMVLLSSATTFLYMEQLDIVKKTFSDPEHRTQIFSRIDYVVQSLTMVFQFFLTGRIAQRFGVVTLLTVVPVLMVGGFLGLAATGTFAVLAGTMILRRVGEYAFIRPGREMLYSVVDTETKYKAKAFNDVPVYRGGDALAAQAQGWLKAAGTSAAEIAVIGAGIAALWAATGWFLGRKVK